MSWWAHPPAGGTVAALWRKQAAATILHHTLSRKKYKRAGGNEAVVFPFEAILQPSIYISESVAHQRGIYSPSVLLLHSAGKCNLTPLCLHVSGGQCSAGREKHSSKWGCGCRYKVVSSPPCRISSIPPRSLRGLVHCISNSD